MRQVMLNKKRNTHHLLEIDVEVYLRLGSQTVFLLISKNWTAKKHRKYYSVESETHETWFEVPQAA